MRNFICKSCTWSGPEDELDYDDVESCMGNDKIEICPKCGSMNVLQQFSNIDNDVNIISE